MNRAEMKEALLEAARRARAAGKAELASAHKKFAALLDELDGTEDQRFDAEAARSNVARWIAANPWIAVSCAFLIGAGALQMALALARWL